MNTTEEKYCDLIALSESNYTEYYSCKVNESLRNDCQTVFQHQHFKIYECQNNIDESNPNLEGIQPSNPNNPNTENVENATKNKTSIRNQTQETEKEPTVIINATTNNTLHQNTTLHTVNATEYIQMQHKPPVQQTSDIKLVLSIFSIAIAGFLVCALCSCYVHYKCENKFKRCKKMRQLKRRRSSRSISPEAVVVDVKEEQKEEKEETKADEPTRPPKPNLIEEEIKTILQTMIRKVELNILRERKQLLRRQRRIGRNARLKLKPPAPNTTLAKLALYNVMRQKQLRAMNQPKLQPKKKQGMVIKEITKKV